MMLASSSPADAGVREPSLSDYVRPGDRILIIGGYGLGNVGDDAILAGMLSQVPAGAQATVVSRNPVETAALHRVRAIAAWQAGAALVCSDVIVFGGGGMFSRHMGPFARAIPAFGTAAWLLRKRVLFHGVGIYDSTPGYVKAALRVLIPRLALLTVRDGASVESLRSWGIDARRIHDLSTGMPEARPDVVLRLLRSLGLESNRPVVGLALTATDPALEPALLREIPLLVKDLPGVQFCFMPMSRHPTVPQQNDLVLARKLVAAAPGLRVLDGAHHPAEVLGLFGRFDAMVAMRFHSLLFSERAGVPVIPISYAEKTRDWIAAHGLEEAPISAAVLSDRIRRVLATQRVPANNAVNQ